MFDAKPGNGDELGALLKAGRVIALAEAGTVTWYASTISDTSHGIFDTFETDEARQTHHDGQTPAHPGRSLMTCWPPRRSSAASTSSG